MDDLAIVRAEEKDLDAVARLFNSYRQFYGQSDNLREARSFIRSRLIHGDSLILLARTGSSAVGFAQMYPSFSSVAMRRVWILNDLFVSEESRRTGVAKQLLDRAETHARDDSAARLLLATAIDNTAAKNLYEAAGWTRDEAFDHYVLLLS